MIRVLSISTAVHAFCFMLAMCTSAHAQLPEHEDRLDALFAMLQESTGQQTDIIEGQIIELWSDSGSRIVNDRFEMAKFLAETGAYRSSLRMLDGILLSKPDFAEGWNLRATILYLLGDFAASVRAIERCLELNPRHFGALNGLALMLERTGDHGTALEAYRAVAQLSPNRRGVRDAMARLEGRLAEDLS